MYPYLMILKGKHGNDYFHVDNEQALVDSYRKIFDINNENNFYCFLKDDEYDAKITNLREKITEESNSGIINLIDSKLNIYRKSLRYYTDDRAEAKLFELARVDDRAMVKFVTNRSDFEYEKIVTESYS